MTRMDCDEVRDLLAAFADDELSPGERGAVGDHLSGCPQCRQALASLTALSARLRRAGTHDLPEGFEARLRQRVGAEALRETRPAWRRFAMLAASHAAAAILAATLAVTLSERNGARDRAVAQVVSAHIRSTLADLPVQIASSDSHTVRPWFVGRLPFAPPVRDLTQAGFPLLGGRLDHVVDRTAAALVYGRRKHRINLFILPAGDAATARSALTGATWEEGLRAGRDGYSVLGWRDGAFIYFAVSDLNAGELERFSALLKEAG